MTTIAASESEIFARIIAPEQEGLSLEAARSILALSFAPADLDRVDVLSEKARQGTLTAVEQEELDNYLRVGTFLAILQSKARLCLKRATQPAESTCD
jgi:hypothetical protein